MPIRHCWPGSGSPNTAMSPPAFTMAAAALPRSSASASSAAQPFTRPVGSTPPCRPPGVEPAARGGARPAAEIKDLGHLGRRGVELYLAAPQAAHGAVRLPGAEHVVDVVQHRDRALEGGGEGFVRRRPIRGGRAPAAAGTPAAADPLVVAEAAVSAAARIVNDTTVPITCSECCIGASRGGDLVERRLQ